MKTKLVIVMRTDLNLSPGKMVSIGSRTSRRCYVDASYRSLSRFDLANWLQSGCTEVSVGCDSQESISFLKEKATELGLVCNTTESRGSIICLALGPADVSKVDEVTGHLSLL